MRRCKRCWGWAGERRGWLGFVGGEARDCVPPLNGDSADGEMRLRSNKSDGLALVREMDLIGRSMIQVSGGIHVGRFAKMVRGRSKRRGRPHFFVYWLLSVVLIVWDPGGLIESYVRERATSTWTRGDDEGRLLIIGGSRI